MKTKLDGASAKPTPGPWRYERMPFNLLDGYRDWHVFGDLDATCEGEPDPTFVADCRHFASSEANARLIAAAPDLLEACKLANQFLLDQGHANSDTNCPLNQLWAAIAKATGKDDA